MGLTSYDVTLGSRRYRLWDMPGAGDLDVPAYTVLEMLGAAFENIRVHGLFILSAKPERMPLGAQVTIRMMSLSFLNPDKWSSVVLVGTKNDKYDPDDEQNFKTGVLRAFNDSVKGTITKVCTCSHKDWSAVQDMMTRMTTEAGIGDYATPDAAAVAEVFCDGLGLPAGALRNEEMEKVIAQIQADRTLLREKLRNQREVALQQQWTYDQGMHEMYTRLEHAQQQQWQLIGDMRKDAEKQQRKMETLIANSQKQSGFCISIWPPAIRF